MKIKLALLIFLNGCGIGVSGKVVHEVNFDNLREQFRSYCLYVLPKNSLANQIEDCINKEMFKFLDIINGSYKE